MTGHKHSEFYY